MRFQEARSEFAQASNRMARTRILTDGGEDVTEAVVTVLDCLYGSLDWGSDFLSETDVEDAMGLMKILGFRCWHEVWIRDKPDSKDNYEGHSSGHCLELIGHDGDHVFAGPVSA